jgi:cytoskeleton protein RodZ
MHVDSRILESLEAEDFAALGAAVYARGHLRNYAELVGEQPAELQELYANSSRAVPVQPDLTRIAHAPVENDSSLVGSAVVVLVTIAAIGTLWWFLNSPNEKPQATAVQDSGQTSPARQPASSPQVAAAGAGGSGVGTSVEHPVKGAATAQPRERALDAGSTTRAAAEGPRSAAATVAAASGPRPRSATTSPEAPAITAAATTTAANATKSSPSTAPPTTRAKEGELTLKFSSDSWAEVYDSSGHRLFYDVGAASTAHTVRGPVPMRVVLGNAAGVVLEFNGRPAPIPSSVASDGSVRFTLTAHGRAVPATDGG